jgi:hypothetical protein
MYQATYKGEENCFRVPRNSKLLATGTAVHYNCNQERHNVLYGL